MSNPNNAIGTNAAFGGRTSVNAFNDDLSAWTRGVMSGWACVPDSGMTIKLGGSATVRDVAVAEDNSGNKTTINNISALPVSITISGAPASNTRIDSVVAYVDNPPQGVSTVADNASACGIIVVEGTASSTPVAPNDSAIRTAITADGATGTTAYYTILANVTVANGTTTITAGEIMAGDVAQLSGTGVATADNIDFTTTTGSDGWTKMKIADNVNLYMTNGEGSVGLGGGTWTTVTLRNKPIDLNLSNTFFSNTSARCGDDAINASPTVSGSNGNVLCQISNMSNQTVSSDIYYDAMIIEILN